jgi:GDP-fucose transporter C1
VCGELTARRNKWVLNSTTTPLFFLLAQFLIAVALFLACHAAGLISIPLEVNARIVKGLAPAVSLSVVGLRYLPRPTVSHARC